MKPRRLPIVVSWTFFSAIIAGWISGFFSRFRRFWQVVRNFRASCWSSGSESGWAVTLARRELTCSSAVRRVLGETSSFSAASLRICADLVEHLLRVAEPLALQGRGPLDALAHVVQHEGDPLRVVHERDLGDQAGGDGGTGRAQSRAAQPGIGEVIERDVESRSVLDLDPAGAIPEPILPVVVEPLVLLEFAVHPHLVDPGRFVGDLRHVVVPLHRGLGVDAPGLRGVEVVHARAHRVVAGALQRGALGRRGAPSAPSPAAIPITPLGAGLAPDIDRIKQRPRSMLIRRIIVDLQATNRRTWPCGDIVRSALLSYTSGRRAVRRLEAKACSMESRLGHQCKESQSCLAFESL